MALFRTPGRGARPRDPLQHRGLRAAARVTAASHAGRRPLVAGRAPRRSGRPTEEVSLVLLSAWQCSYAVRFLAKYGGARRSWCTGWCTRALGHLPGLHPNCDYPANPKKIREPTSGLEPLTCSLRVISQALQGFAHGCKARRDKPVSFLYLAVCCTVLRSRWYQSGINITLVSAIQGSSTPGSFRPTSGKPCLVRLTGEPLPLPCASCNQPWARY